MRNVDIFVSVSGHAACVALLLLWSAAQPAPQPKTFSLGMVELVRPRTVAPPASPVAAQPAASAPEPPAPVTSAQPVAAPPKAPAVTARPAPIVAKNISPKKRPTASSTKPSPPSPVVSTASEQAQSSATPESSGSGGETGKSAAPSRIIGGMGVYDAEVVDIPPKIVSRELPQYPPNARRLHLEGTVLVSMVIDIQGKPRHCTIRKAVPEGVFEESALAAANSYRFVPGKVGGQNVATLVVVPFHFTMTN